MDDISDSMKKLIFSMRLIFVASVISIIGLATAIKRPFPAYVAPSNTLPDVAMLANFNTPKESPVQEVVADDPEVPEAGEIKEKTKEEPKAEPKNDTPEQKVEKSTPTYSNTTRNYTANTTTPSTSQTPNTPRTTNDESDNPYGYYVDDNGVEIVNPTTYPIPNHDDPEPTTPEEPTEPETNE